MIVKILEEKKEIENFCKNFLQHHESINEKNFSEIIENLVKNYHANFEDDLSLTNYQIAIALNASDKKIIGSIIYKYYRNLDGKNYCEVINIFAIDEVGYNSQEILKNLLQFCELQMKKINCQNIYTNIPTAKKTEQKFFSTQKFFLKGFFFERNSNS